MFKIGDRVILKSGSPLYKSSASLIPSSYLKSEKQTVITRVASGSKHPYNTTGDLGWMNESDIKLYNDDKKYEVEIELVDKSGLIDYLKEHEDKIIMIDAKELKDVLGL